MIPKVGQAIDVKNINNVFQNKVENGLKNKNNQMQNTIQSNPIESKLQREYYINFGASLSKTAKRRTLLEEQYTVDTNNMLERAGEIAKEYGHREITETHIEKAALEFMRDYLGDLSAGDKVFDPSASFQVPVFFAKVVSPVAFTDKKRWDKVLPVVTEEIKALDSKLAKIKKPKSALGGKKPILSERIINGVYGIVAEKGSKSIPTIEEGAFLGAIYEMNEKKGENTFRQFLMKFSEAVMINNRKPEEKIALSFYEEKARNVLNNLAHGTQMFVTYDKKADPVYLIDTIADVLEKDEKGFGNLNRDNTRLTIFSSSATDKFAAEKLRELVKDKNTTHIAVFDLDGLILSSAIPTEDGSGLKMGIGVDFLRIMGNAPENLKIILAEGKDSYYKNMSGAMFKGTFEPFGEASVPVLSAEQAKKAFREQPLLMHKIAVKFSKTAVDRIVDATALLEGAYPEKVQKVMKKLASFYVGKKEVTEADVLKYLEETKDSLKPVTESSSVEIVFDTGKKLKDFWGKEATRKEAEAFVRQIKAKTLGTKGAIIYSQDGSVGAGKKFTAKAIAGETKSPYVEINALDFGTKETNLFGGDMMTPENSIKKLFSLLTTQAEAIPTKSAVLFVDNFELFSLGERVSAYHQIAMSQLLREMENASKKGLNVLVLGSVSNPDLIGDSTLKSSKFISRIEVESPSRNIEAREEIISNFVKKERLHLNGEKQELVRLMAETTESFPFIYLRNMVSKVKSVAFERGHRKIDKKDIVEAYLQLTTGRTSSRPISEHRKKIVASHECGHGFNTEYMWRLANKQNIPWHMNDKVNFITLDPRGVFGGAMYSKHGGNEEYSFEKIFSELICDFGGHSAEKHFYNIDGSWGITSDMQMATRTTEQAVGVMGQGKHFGKVSLAGMHMSPSQKSLEVFERDRNAILENARLVSDLITKFGTTFNQAFTEKYAKSVGTGDCLVHGDTFRQEIAEWLSKQTKGKLAEMEQVDQTILKIIEAAKQGKKFNINSDSVPKAVRKLYKSVASYIK